MFDIDFASLLVELVEATQLLVTEYPRLALWILGVVVLSGLTRGR